MKANPSLYLTLVGAALTALTPLPAQPVGPPGPAAGPVPAAQPPAPPAAPPDPAAPPPAPLAPGAAPDPRGPVAPRDRGPDANNNQACSGIVDLYVLNPHGEIDGLILSDGTQVKFPPHMSADLAREVKPKDCVQIQGSRESGCVVTAFIIRNTNTGREVVESRPSQFPTPLPPELRGVDLKAMNAEGRIKRSLLAPRGEPEGVVLEDGTILRLPPHLGAAYASILAVGQSVKASGYGTSNGLGRAFEVTALGASGQAMLQLYGAPVPNR